MILVQEKEIVEVPGDVLGRRILGVEVELRPVGERRENPGQEGFLDLAGDAQFALDRLLGLGRGREVPDVLVEVADHLVQDAGQFLDLVLPPDALDSAVQVAGGDPAGESRQLPQRVGDAVRGPDDDGQDAGQPHRHEDDLPDQLGLDRSKDPVLGDHGGECPPAGGDGGVDHPALFAGVEVLEGDNALPPADHVFTDGPEIRPVQHFGQAEQGFAHDEIGIGMGDERSAPADEERVSGDDLDAPHRLIELGQGDVGGHDAGERSFPEKGMGKRAHQGVPAFGAVVGLRPVGALQELGNQVPIGRMIGLEAGHTADW